MRFSISIALFLVMQLLASTAIAQPDDCIGRVYATGNFQETAFQETEKEMQEESSKEKISQEKIKAGANFKTENLVAWCIVPFLSLIHI